MMTYMINIPSYYDKVMNHCHSAGSGVILCIRFLLLLNLISLFLLFLGRDTGSG